MNAQLTRAPTFAGVRRPEQGRDRGQGKRAGETHAERAEHEDAVHRLGRPGDPRRCGEKPGSRRPDALPERRSHRAHPEARRQPCERAPKRRIEMRVLVRVMVIEIVFVIAIES